MAGSSSTSSTYNIVYQLNAVVTPAFRRSVGQAEDSIEEIARIVRGLSRLSGFDDLRRSADDADDSVDELSKKTGKLGSLLEGIKKKSELFSEIKEGIEPLTKIMTALNESADAMAQLQASTGMTTNQMEDMEEITNNLYKQNYGTGFEDLGNSLGLVKQVLQQSGDELEKTTQNAITYRDVFKGELPDSLKAVNAMIQQFGITSEQSYNLMAQGAQKGLNSTGELLDTASKYSVYFDKMGYSADEMFDVFSAGIKHGATSLDGVADTVKEFSTAITGDSDSVKEAIYKLFAPEQLEEFSAALVKGGTESVEYATLLKAAGKTAADTLTKDLTAGGDSAEQAMKELQKTLGSGESIFKGLSDGSLTGKQAMEQVIQKLKDIKDPVEQAQIAGELFGSQFADIGSEAVLALGSTRNQFDMTRQTMEEVAEVKYDTLTQQFQAVGREMMTGLIIPLGETLMPHLQNLVHWLSNNKELMMALSLAAPAAAITTNSLKIVQGFMKIGSAAGGAGGAAGGFAGVLGLLTNPVGIAVTGIGLLTTGIIAYKNHQENARQELIHMGDALKESGNQYQEAKDKAKLTNDLLWEYDQLTEKISSSAASSDELATHQERLKEITENLQGLHGTTISQYDVENGKMREKAGLAKEIADADEKLAKLQLEKDIAVGKEKLPDTVSQIRSLEEQVAAAEAKRDAISEAVPKFKEYSEQFERLMMMPGTEDQKKQIDELVQKAQEAGEAVGIFINSPFDLNGLGSYSEQLASDEVTALEKLITASEDLNDANQSYQELYNQRKSLIEFGLGSTIEEQAAKFNSLSDEEKNRFNDALSLVRDLNDEMYLLPLEKKIDIELVYKQTGQYLPEAPKTAVEIIESLSGKYRKMDQYAEGGIATRPSIFGEAGPEIAIPLNNKPRSRSLLDRANDLMGYTSNTDERVIQVTNSPVINISGADSSVMLKVNDALKRSEDSLERRLKAIVEQQRRVSFQ